MAAANLTGASLTVPGALLENLVEGSDSLISTHILVSAAEHHLAQNTTIAGPTPLGSTVTSIVLRSPGSAGELQVAQLEEGLTVTLPFDWAGAEGQDATEGGLTCVWWDDRSGAYSGAGCAALPNPSPPAAGVYWNQTNTSLLEGGDLRRAWEIQNASM
eukprot:gene30608-38289_t